jgi:hypothetical protein
LRNGNGLLINRNGDEYSGVFSEGIKCGHGKIKFANGKVFQGHFEAGRREGQGKLFSADEMLIYSGNWISGRPETEFL